MTVAAASMARKAAGLLVTVSPRLDKALIARLGEVAERVYSYPVLDKAQPTAEELASIDVVLCDVRGLPKYITDIERQCPRLKLVQASNSGVTNIVQGPGYLGASPGVRQSLTICNASGLHVITIPPYVLTTIHMIYLRLNEQHINAQVHGKWVDQLPDLYGKPYAGRTIRGRTVGLLGYGHLGRETARLLKAYGAHVIAANTRGTRSTDTGYVVPGTGDADATLPEDMYSTSDEASLAAFLARCDVLVSSLPSTPKTRNLLTRQRLALLPRNAVLVNVGRGDVVRTEDILWALDRPLDDGNGPLLGAIVDVTEPEPLEDGHPLFTHPRAIVTPHLAGDSEGELETASDICYNNVMRLLSGDKLLNVVDVEKGY
ncbi:hypothetical protein FA10DRAFT_267458 [Acaromyces ingoldii]|uniref:D-isomer specific 2-hydroxyacid dehydrogenase NAD-binding domain-containing protein n=1 Tax=Acaromyces ingoldii TaxID=215250 RepID=A0A316YTH3_9BASI|nr:hypothetical protein FA10DRAFT_267458 [Acaromyces ingoldii]PWN91045.1 hypothetical protein FA10DRAFT_267458 [Acaromyces ingoldii]